MPAGWWRRAGCKPSRCRICPRRHASHTFGKDVDISVYDAQGHPVWYPLCDEINDECIPGTDKGFHGEAMARKIAPMLESSRVTHIFLDAEFHMTLFAAAEGLVDEWATNMFV